MAGTRHRSMGPPCGIDLMTHCTTEQLTSTSLGRLVTEQVMKLSRSFGDFIMSSSLSLSGDVDMMLTIGSSHTAEKQTTQVRSGQVRVFNVLIQSKLLQRNIYQTPWSWYQWKALVRSGCLTCSFRASCCSACLSRAQVPPFASSSVQNKIKKRGDGVRGDCLHWRVQGSTSSPTRIGSRRTVV